MNTAAMKDDIKYICHLAQKSDQKTLQKGIALAGIKKLR
jgi:hypothetical protein